MKLSVNLGWLLPIGLMITLGGVAYFFFFGNSSSESGIAASACVTKCQKGLIEGINTTAGPCLSNQIESNWVCDMAHNPRQATDDLPENQCSAYREGSAKHFVEVDANCKIIQSN